MKTIATIVALLFALNIQAQTIEKFSIDSGGDIATAAGLEIVYTIGEVNVQELSIGGLSVSEGFINASFRIQIDPKVFLQGPLLSTTTAGLMNDDLRSNNYIPTTSPYSDAVTVDASVFTVIGNNAIVDWVWVELRAANDNTKLVNATSALLQRDGDIVDLDGVSNLVMSAAPTNYYVVVKHRNHLGAMSSQTITLSEDTATVVDFKNASFSTYGTNAQVTLNTGDTALWAGDTNGDGKVSFSGDITSVTTDIILFPANTSFSSSYGLANGYFKSDVFLDGNVSFSNENNQILLSILLYPLNTSFSSQYNLFVEQLPSPAANRSAAQAQIDLERQEIATQILNNLN